ncbi:hypothetical protein [Streptomyces sp. TLI_105]|uniref:hypothetical protein n=1 Tax=Streptomyces sp. TLI_105 TaxID=1881019 RepID=UPI00115F81F5|nr:hypothetical protein [Streptomyces sp. TLI_105]
MAATTTGAARWSRPGHLERVQCPGGELGAHARLQVRRRLADCAGAVAEFGVVLDRHLRSRPADYLVSFRALLAVEEEYHWANALEGFEDDIHHVDCPHCGMGVTIAVGGFGCYPEAWDGGERMRRDLRPAAAEDLTGTGRWMHQVAVRDGQEVLANGIAPPLR